MKAAGLLAAVVLAACTREPRSVSYFEAHASEIEPTLRACATEAQRGQECENAQQAQHDLAAKARLELYRRSFN